MATQAYTTPFNLTESPVLAMPIGLSTKNLPIGIQVIGKKYSDYRLLNVGKVLTNYAEKIDYPLNNNSKN
jgi:Asp-tRNA(Asn)/Glu-tRNA(Gln) amidotransferase A subunit family amidase